MIRNLSNMCFGVALGSSLLMKLFAVQDDLIWLAVFSVTVSAILTNLQFTESFAIWPRSMGFAGVGGLSIVYFKLGGSSLSGTILTIVTTTLLVTAVLMAIYADLSNFSNCSQGDEKSHEVSF